MGMRWGMEEVENRQNWQARPWGFGLWLLREIRFMASTIESVAEEEERKKEVQQAKAERETLFVLPHRHCCLSSPHPPTRQPAANALWLPFLFFSRL